MIDVFLKTNTPIADIPKALSGFDCSCICVRNGGPTEVWERTREGWQKRKPGMTLYEDLTSSHVALAAYRYERVGYISAPVGDGMVLLLDAAEAAEWLAAMEPHRYAIEDAIGCSVNIEHAGSNYVCAAALLPVSEFKNLTDPATALGQKVLNWVSQIVSAGADQVDIAISVSDR